MSHDSQRSLLIEEYHIYIYIYREFSNTHLLSGESYRTHLSRDAFIETPQEDEIPKKHCRIFRSRQMATFVRNVEDTVGRTLNSLEGVAADIRSTADSIAATVHALPQLTTNVGEVAATLRTETLPRLNEALTLITTESIPQVTRTITGIPALIDTHAAIISEEVQRVGLFARLALIAIVIVSIAIVVFVIYYIVRDVSRSRTLKMTVRSP